MFYDSKKKASLNGFERKKKKGHIDGFQLKAPWHVFMVLMFNKPVAFK